VTHREERDGLVRGGQRCAASARTCLKADHSNENDSLNKMIRDRGRGGGGGEGGWWQAAHIGSVFEAAAVASSKQQQQRRRRRHLQKKQQQ